MIRTFVLVIASSFASLAHSITATYSTFGSQLCYGAAGCGVASQTVGNVVLTFVPTSRTVNFSSFSYDSFGQLVVSCVSGGTSCANESLTSTGVRLYINISQTAPSTGNGSLAGGQFIGEISGTASNASVQWNIPPDVQIGVIRYSITNSPLGLNAPAVNGGAAEVGALLADMTGVPVAPTLSYSTTLGNIAIAQAPRGATNASLAIAISTSGAANGGNAVVSNCSIVGANGISVSTTPPNGTFNTSVTSGSINATCQRNWQMSTGTLTCTVTPTPGTAVERSWPLVCPSLLADGADVDGNGSAGTLTDGLLISRYLLGLRGSALTHGAIGANAARNTAFLIETYLFYLTGQ